MTETPDTIADAEGREGVKTNGGNAAKGTGMQYSDNISEFAPAFVAAQAEIDGATKGSKNGHLGNSYADLTSVAEACRPALNKNGIAVLQTPVQSDDPGKLKLETWLMHKSGQFARGELTIPIPKNDPQGYGSALTYARRYHLAAMTGVCPEDDDAEGAMGRNGNQPPRHPSRPAPPPNRPAQRPAPPPPAAPPVTQEVVNEETGEVTNPEHDAGEVVAVTAEQTKEIADLLAKIPNAAKIAVGACNQYGVKRLSELTTEHAASVIANLKSLAAGVMKPAQRKAG